MYFIALVLPEALNQKILPLKNGMQDKFGCRVGLKSPAHITIAPPFWMDAEKEVLLLSDLDAFCSNVTPFTIQTQNFSAFRPRTIFIDVAHSEPLWKLKEQSDAFFRSKPEYKIKIETRPFHPHITIATRDLHKKAFAEAWPLFENKTFIETWEAGSLSVLKHNTRTWDVIHNSAFEKTEN
jgi:2'-5' RNA ligase